MFPDRGWDSYEKHLRLMGEQRFTGRFEELGFLVTLGFLDATGALTSTGHEYFLARYVLADDAAADGVLRLAVLEVPACAALIQLLAGRTAVSRDRAMTALRCQGFGEGLTDRTLGQVLALLNRVGAIRYAKRTSTFEVTVNLSAAPEPPRSIFIAPDSPYGNRTWLRRVLEECSGFIYWLDKHFMPSAFEALWEAADATRISEVRILSLALPDNSSRKARSSYRDLRREFVGKGMSLEWRIVTSQGLRATHDRWIIGAGTARNVPNVNAILSGQHSELIRSDDPVVLRSLFEGYWHDALPYDQTPARAA
jgi:hypothetical protein